MQWILLFWLLNAFKRINTQSDIRVTITSSKCRKTYDMVRYSSVYLEYSGLDPLGTDQCDIEFLNDDSIEQVICVSTQELSIDCETKLEYHENFVKDYIEPEKRITCVDTSLGEWCSEKYTHNLFIVIRKRDERSPDGFKLRLYRKQSETSKSYSSSTTSILLITLLPGMLILILVLSAVRIVYHRMAQRLDARRTQYQTASAASSMQTGQGHATTPQPVTGYQPVPQEVGSQHLLSGYHIHAMQTAVPVNQDTSPVTGYHPQVPTSAPSVEPGSADPPSYDSLFTRQ